MSDNGLHPEYADADFFITYYDVMYESTYVVSITDGENGVELGKQFAQEHYAQHLWREFDTDFRPELEWYINQNGFWITTNTDYYVYPAKKNVRLLK